MMISVKENEKLYYVLFPDEKPTDETADPHTDVAK